MNSACSILVVEDELAVHEALSLVLGKAGYKVTAAANGQTGLESGDTAENLRVAAALRKPFDMEEVQASIRLALDSKAK